MSKTTLVLILIVSSALLSFAWPEGTTCGTQHPTHEMHEHGTKRALPACAIHECDDPSVRNLYLLTSQSPLITINMNVIYFGQLSGTAKTTYDAQIEFFQQEYRKHMNITFNINTTAITDQHQTLDVTNGGLVFQIAGQYYIPGSLTVLLSPFSPNPQNLLGYSYLPQAIDLKLYPQHLFAAIDLAKGISTRGTALLHETGHMLGLLHAFTDISSSTCQSRCVENNNSTNLDSVGDYCSDTKPVSKSFSCSSLTQLKDCNNMAYPTDMSQLPQDNYMVYTPASCQTRFTPQQAARARCYVDRLVSFVTVAPPSAPVVVPVPIASPLGTPVSGPLSTPVDASVPQSDTTPSAAPMTSGAPSSSPVAKQTPTSSLTSLGTGLEIVAVLIFGLVLFVVSM